MAQQRKFITQPSEDKLNQFPPAVRDLVKKGHEHGFVTHQELLKVMPNVEDDLTLLDELYALFLDLGIEVIDTKESLTWKGETEETGEVGVEEKTKKASNPVELRDIANDAIRV